jgi:hypothetical protein
MTDNHTNHHDTTQSVMASAVDVRRFQRLRDEAKGAMQVAQAAANAGQAAQNALNMAIQELCADEGVNIAENSNVDINWKTGEITITPPAPEPPPIPSVPPPATTPPVQSPSMVIESIPPPN